MKSKYIKRGVKRKHNIIQGILVILEDIAKIDGVKKVIPAKISYSPKRSIGDMTITFQRNTFSGFKLIARGKGSIQEIFVVVDGSKKDFVENELKKMLGDLCE